MATLSQIRPAIKTTLEAAISGLAVYPYVKGSVAGHCVIVEPGDTDFLVAMGRGNDTYFFSLVVLVPTVDWELAQKALDDYVCGFGTRSIRQAIFNNRSLGLSETDAHITNMTDYGGRHEAGGVEHIGARLQMTVHTRGDA